MQTINSSKRACSPKLIQWNNMDGNADSELINVPIKPGALLLTAAPMESFGDELVYFCQQIGRSLHRVICAAALSSDSQVEQLVAASKLFNTPMLSVAQDIHYLLCLVIGFYKSRWGFGGLVPDSIDQESFPCLLDPKFHKEKRKLALRASLLAAVVARRLRQEVLPLLPQLEKHLNGYVTDFVSRYAVKLQRDKSWVPSVLYETIWGPDAFDACHEQVLDVVQLPLHMSTGTELMHKLPAFLDNLELHLRRSGEVDSQQLLDLGYATVEDFKRLFRDRLTSHDIGVAMACNWFPVCDSFALGASGGLRERIIATPA